MNSKNAGHQKMRCVFEFIFLENAGSKR